MPDSVQQTRNGPIVLLIVDGWGLSPTWRGNAVNLSNPPVMERLWREYPHTVLQAFQPESQSRKRQIGNSEISHAMIGSGRFIKPDLEEISDTIKSGHFEKNPILLDAFRSAVQKNRPVHLLGLASDGGIHSNLEIPVALLKYAKSLDIKNVFLHLILDGRDTPQTSGIKYLGALEQVAKKLNVGQVSTFIGRNFAMDRDNHWDRTLVAYRLWTLGEGKIVANASDGLKAAYREGLTDEFMTAHRVKDSTLIRNGDVVICWNTRADRLRQLARSFIDPMTLRSAFVRQAPSVKLSKLTLLVSPRLSSDLPIDIAFPPARIPSCLPEILSGRGIKQLKAAESEKYAHITYFINGGREEPFPGEERLIIASPKTARPDQTPEMSTIKVIDQTIARLNRENFGFVAINIANVDLVGHTGNLFATAEAIKIADKAIGKLAEAVIAKNGTLIITSDHGNAEQMLEMPGAEPDQSHTINPVPFILVNSSKKRDLLKQAVVTPPSLLADLVRSRATLADIAPTILDLFDLPIPVEMTGQSLLEKLH